MTDDLIRWFGYGAFAYFAVMQIYMFVIAIISGNELRHTYHIGRFGRITEMLSSKTSPPVSIVIPAYNEAAGIVDSVRSMSIVSYPRFEIVITNDGSTDETLKALIEAFDLEQVRIPYRPDIPTAPVRAIYRGRGAVEITVIDKENGGRADALNAGINAARYPYALCTDADVILLSARLGDGAPVTLRWDDAAKRSVGTLVVPATLASGPQEVVFEAVDAAKNHGFARARLEVRP